ncbi:imelysin family protein [Ascidiaceihabitans sp.]|uniref:imelysin family protein n=1 Tax=Ascidiaceihabitans sp. TaxID=1872644 RepID=UPI003297C637
MRPTYLSFALLLLPALAQADAQSDAVETILGDHILPGFEQLAGTAQNLANTATEDCDPTSQDLKVAYGAAFDAWVSVSHLRFGPTEVDDRAFALAFWPDSRGATPRALNSLIAAQDPVVASVADYGEVSIAARGFYAMEFLLFDDAISRAGDAQYHCALVQTVSADIAATTQNIYAGWQSNFTQELRQPSADGTYRSTAEVSQELFKALSTGLQFTSDTRLGRPLGAFDRPRPKRAEAHRSGRSAQHVMLSLTALRDLAARLAGGDAELAARLDARFQTAMSQLKALNDPSFASVADPQSRLKVEVLQQSVDAIRATVRDELGPTLGVEAGFNALDGD